MKKRKFNILLNFVTICLSICAIAIGVYSIKTATLKVNGSIGFTAHECNVDIVTSMYGDSAESDSNTAPSVASGVVRSEANAKVYGKIGVYSSTETLDLGTLYFCDKTENGKISPITLSFSITNKSAYNYIDVKVNQDCINNDRIFIYAPNNGETLAPRKTITITMQIQLQKDSTENYSSLGTEINFSGTTLLNFEKSQAPSYLATDWKTKIGSAFSSAASISFVNVLDESIKSDTSYEKINVGALSATSAQTDLTNNTSVTDVIAYYNSTSIIIYSPARIYAPQNCDNMFMFSVRPSSTLTNLNLSNFDTSKVTDMSNMFANNLSLRRLDVSNFDTSSVTNIGSMFSGCSGLTSLDVSNFDTSKVTNMGDMFRYCETLTSLDVSNFDTSSVTNIGSMFSGCSGLTSLDVSNFDTSKVTNMGDMFRYCETLTSLDVSNFDTSSVTNIGSMFSKCSGLTSLDVSKFITSSVISMYYMFSECSGLTSLDLSSFNTSKVTSMSGMFSSCSKLTSLDVRSFITSSVESMRMMFDSCEALTSLDVSKFDTSKVTDMSVMFQSCKVLTSLDLSNFKTSSVTNMSYMFYHCRALEKIYVNLTNWKTDKVTFSSYMFNDCTKLVGGAGTIYNSSKTDITYARVDGGTSNPGYLTKKA